MPCDFMFRFFVIVTSSLHLEIWSLVTFQFSPRISLNFSYFLPKIPLNTTFKYPKKAPNLPPKIPLQSPIIHPLFTWNRPPIQPYFNKPKIDSQNLLIQPPILASFFTTITNPRIFFTNFFWKVAKFG